MLSWLLIIYAVIGWVIRIAMIPVILRRRFAPGTAWSWLGLIFILPEIGLALYLLVGVSHLGKKRARTHYRVVERGLSERRRFFVRDRATPIELDAEQRMMVRQAEALSGNPIVGGNALEPISTADTLVERLVADLDAAEHHVHMLYYIFVDDEIGGRVIEALSRAAQRGLICRLLVDDAGSRRLLRSEACRRLKAAGVDVRGALPAQPWRKRLSRIDLRNHRKLAVIDGRIAYTGSHNMIREDYGHRRAGKWVDLSVRCTGPLVGQVQAVFLDDWAFEAGHMPDEPHLFPELSTAGDVAGHVVPTGPYYQTQTFQRVLLAALSTAQDKIIMTTPYLVPDEPTMLALSMAAERGVAVTIVVPRRSDHPLVGAAGRAYIEPLLDAGVHVHRYTRGLLHAKTMTVDNAFALIGSANLDIRSFELNFELSTLLYGSEITGKLRYVQRAYLADAVPIDLDAWRRRPAYKQLTEQAASLFSPLL